MTSAASRDDRSVGRLIKLMGVLWLAGVAMRLTILAMPPVIPLVHDELHMSETQVGLLIGLPLAIFALAAVPGSLWACTSSKASPSGDEGLGLEQVSQLLQNIDLLHERGVTAIIEQIGPGRGGGRHDDFLPCPGVL